MTKESYPGTRPAGARGEAEAAQAVREMFSRIAPRYDLLNRLLSLSLDQSWRRKTARAVAGRLEAPGARALDLCCGTAELALEVAGRSRALVVGIDFAWPMLSLAGGKIARRGARVALAGADALRLPFADNTFDIVTAAFGFRNLADYARGMAEIRRVLKPGGEAAILDFAMPERGLFAALYSFYFRKVLPSIGRAVSGVRGPYSYLPASVERFPGCEEFAGRLREAGFREVRVERWTGGTVALYRAVKS